MALDVPAGRAARFISGGTGSPPLARYLPIAEHGLIGDLHTVALVGTDGTIDWYCCPRFDSPSVFAAILDADHGGLFRIAPDRDGWNSKQLYLPDTNVLITRFLMPGGVGEVQDFMVPPRTGEAARRRSVDPEMATGPQRPQAVMPVVRGRGVLGCVKGCAEQHNGADAVDRVIQAARHRAEPGRRPLDVVARQAGPQIRPGTVHVRLTHGHAGSRPGCLRYYA